MIFNAYQRLGLRTVLLLLIGGQAWYLGEETLSKGEAFSEKEAEYQRKVDSLSSLMAKHESQKKYFKFDPNKLSSSYWYYLGMDDNQVYKLDSFRSKSVFTNKDQVKRILKLDNTQFKLLDTLMYFKDYSNFKSEGYNSSTKNKFNIVVNSYFDPNKLDLQAWQQRGFSEKQANVILQYKIKTRGFKRPKDLLKVFVIDSQKFIHLEKYIQIDTNFLYSTFPKLLDINKSDSSDFDFLRSLNSKNVKQILNYRNRLGGFYSINQVLELKSIDSLSFVEIKKSFYVAEDFIPNRLNVNKTAFDSLKNHPYIGYKLAKKIVDFRSNFRNFNTLDELKELGIINDYYFNKIKLYLETINLSPK